MPLVPSLGSYIPGTPSSFDNTPAEGQVLAVTDFPGIYTTTGPLPIGNGIVATTTSISFDPSFVSYGTFDCGVFGSGGGSYDPSTPCAPSCSGGGVTSVTGGQGISVNPTSGDVQVSIELATSQFTGGVYGITSPDGEANTAAFGANAGENLSTGANNVLIGFGSGTAYTTESNNIVIGTNTTGSVGDNGAIRINNNGSFAALTINGSGACSFSASGFGTIGQVLISGGNNATPTWSSGLIPQTNGFSSMAIGPTINTSPGSSAGNNTYVGRSAGLNNGTTGGNNTYLGSLAGELVVGVSNNVFVGATTGSTITSCISSTLVGYGAGDALTGTPSFTTIFGTHSGYAGTTGEVIIGRDSNFLRLNNSGAFTISTTLGGSNFGLAGQLLSSVGSGGPPVWTSALPQVTVPTASTSSGVQGQIASNSTYFYMYTGGRWQRTAWDATAW